MTQTAKIIADSVADNCPRITTLQCRYNRYIHSEVMTHRVFSRNASSSRAIPIERMIEDVMNDPAIPSHWGSNQKGMQAGVEMPSCEMEWLMARDSAVKYAEMLNSIGLHKQIVNRVLEPFAHINVLITATDWGNFFALRDHEDAQPEIRQLAVGVKDAMDDRDPEWLTLEDWHTPYQEFTGNAVFDRKISAARCASVSYKTVDGKPMTPRKALEIYDKLAGGDPIHASPFEHIATPCPSNDKALTRNFTGWKQYRSEVE